MMIQTLRAIVELTIPTLRRRGELMTLWPEQRKWASREATDVVDLLYRSLSCVRIKPAQNVAISADGSDDGKINGKIKRY